jgi:hypothetical protein
VLFLHVFACANVRHFKVKGAVCMHFESSGWKSAINHIMQSAPSHEDEADAWYGIQS